MQIKRFEALHPNAVVLIADSAYLPAARFVANSIEKKSRATFDIVILAARCAPEALRPADGSRVKVIAVEPERNLAAISHSNRKSTATYLRLGMVDAFRTKYSRILYLDCDLWIGDRDIASLFEVEMDIAAVAAVRDAAEVVRRYKSQWQKYRTQLGISDDANYFNSGVMLIDVENFCRAEIGLECLKYLQSGGFRGSFHDQSALNKVLNGQWLELSPVWNWMYATKTSLTEKYKPGIVHFIGPNKPWKDKKGKHNPKYRYEMQQYLSSVGYNDYVQEVPLVSMMGRQLRIGTEKLGRQLFGDPRERLIDEFLKTTPFVDVKDRYDAVYRGGASFHGV